MTLCSWIVGTCVCACAAGCAGTDSDRVATASNAADASRLEPRTVEHVPAANVAVAERRASPAASRESEERFAVTRQVTALERSIELYGQFIARAGDDPRYAEAVERSRGRIEDARTTICFLLDKPCDGDASR